MPKNPIDYSKTFIYKICCKDPTVTHSYIGHTTNLIKRRNSHKQRCCNPGDRCYDYYFYKIIRDNGGWNNWHMILVEEYCLNNREEALQKERYWLEKLKANLNKQVPSKDIDEYCKENKEKLKEHYKDEIEKRKEYYEENNEKRKEYSKEWRDNNKEKLKEKFTCECGSVCRISDKTKHFKTIKHQEFIKHLNNQ